MTRTEFQELDGLLDMIIVCDCFGVNDLEREQQLWQKATDKQTENLSQKYHLDMDY